MKKTLYILLFAILVTPSFLQAAQPRGWARRAALAAHDDSQNDGESENATVVKKERPIRNFLRSCIQNELNSVNRVQDQTRDLDRRWSESSSKSDPRSIVVVPSSKQYVLLIGVNKYSEPIPSLRFCVNDMHLLAESFVKAGVPEENIILLTDDASEELLPTKANIRRQIKEITDRVGPNDMLIIAFSGHGVMVDGKSYLCPSDTNLANINSIVSRDWAFDQLENCQAQRKIFITDACRNKVSFDGQKSHDSVGQKTLDRARTIEDQDEAKEHGFILMASCDKTQRSWEDADLEHGVFTYYLAKGLAGAACNNDGCVSIFSLFLYASEKTEMYVNKYYNARQVPTMMQGGETTNFILAKVEPPKYVYDDVNTDNADVPRWIKYGFEITYAATDGKISIPDIIRTFISKR